MNPYDKEYMKMAMLKHEEAFRQQVYELHRLYRIQKILMKDCGPVHIKPEARLESENDYADLELTLGSRSYNQKKIKVGESTFRSNSELSLCSSSSGSSQMNRKMMSVSNQDRLNNPPWLFQALSLKMN